MQFLRKSTIGVVASLLTVLLFSFGLAFSIQRVFSTPDGIKSALRESGFYSVAVSAGLDQAQKEQAGNQEDIPVNRPEIQNIIKQAASPEFLQTQTETTLDSLYAWLQGKTETLNFKVDLTDVKARLADGVGQYVGQRLSALPPCQTPVNPNDVDAFNATCVPVGYNAAEAAAKAKDEILRGEFLKDTELTAASIKNNDGKTLDQQLKAVPGIYQRINQGVLLGGLAALLLAVAIVFLSVTRRSGLKKVAITFITIGAISAFLGWLSSFAVRRGSEELAKTSANNPLTEHGVNVAKLLVNDVRFWWMLYGIALVVVGIATLVTLHFTKSKEGHVPTSPEPTGEDRAPAAPARPAPAAKPPAPKPRTRPTKKLVQ
jgi:hypothetical protein